MYRYEYYNRYNYHARGAMQKRIERILFILNYAEIVSESNLNILDIGCGVGDYSIICQERCENVVSIDISKESLYAAKKNGVSNLILASANHLPFVRNTFDRVLLIDVIEHLDDPLGALIEIYNSLTPHGLLILSTIYPSIAGKLIYKLDSTHKHLFTVKELMNMLDSIGFDIDSFVVNSFMPRLYPFTNFFNRYFKTLITIKAKKRG